MTAHTPGPWREGRDTAKGCIRIEAGGVARRDYNNIARVYGTSDLHGPDAQQANARLIAAAPELLEALEAAYTFLSLGPSEAKGITLKARAAIAKAREEGEK